MLNLNNIRLLMFDLDDTLYNFSYYWPRALRSAFKKFSLTLHLDEDKLFAEFERYSNELWELATNKEITFNEYRFMRLYHALREFGMEVDQTEFNEFNRLFIGENLEIIERDEPLVHLMEQLSRRYKLSIVTNGPGDIAMEKIARIGLGHLFDHQTVFISEKIGYSKPHPKIFQLVLEHHGVSAEESLFVGDSWTADILGPMKVGIGTIWINPNQNEPLSNHQPTLTFTEIYQLRAILNL